MKEGMLPGRWTQVKDKGIPGMGNRRSKVMIQKVQCAQKSAVNGPACLEHKEVS